jgi:hypothetical protein
VPARRHINAGHAGGPLVRLADQIRAAGARPAAGRPGELRQAGDGGQEEGARARPGDGRALCPQRRPAGHRLSGYLVALGGADGPLDLCRHFGVAPLVCINKHDLSEENSRRIEDHCGEVGVEVVGRIPFDAEVNGAIVQGLPVVETSDGAASREIRTLWGAIAARAPL